MIPLSRIRTVAAVRAAYRGADKTEKDKELLLAHRVFLNDPEKKVTFKDAYWKRAKTQLKKESNGKCAYCEANAQVVAHGDVEHYRPKSIYWWLAYTYDNYLFACQICNQVYKKDNFPFAGIIFPPPSISITMTDAEIEVLAKSVSPDPIDQHINFTFQSYLNAHRAEQALLPNPYFDDISAIIAYEADDVKEEVAMIATNQSAEQFIKAMEDYYGINRIELKNFRYAVFKNFRAFKKAYTALTDAATKREIKRQIEDMKSPRYIFAGMNRFFDARL